MQSLKILRGVNPKLKILLIVTLLWTIADFALEFAFPTYLESIGRSYFEIGLLLSLASLSGIIVDLPIGVLSDKISRRKMMMSGLFLLVIFSILIFFTEGNVFLATVFLLWGVSFQIWKVPRDANFASLSDKKIRGKEYGLEMEIRHFTQTLGAIFCGVLLFYLGFKGILGFYTLLLFISIIIIFFFLKDSKSTKSSVGLKESLGSLKTEFKELKSFGSIGIVLLYFALLFTAWEEVLLALGPLFYGKDVLNLPASIGGVLLASFSFLGIFLSYPAGKLSDKIGRKKVLLIGLIFIGIGLIALSLTKILLFVFIAAFIVSAGWAFSLPSLNGFIVDISCGHKKGRLAGIWDFFMDAGFVIGPILGGLLAQMYGISNVFAIFGIVFIVSSILLIFIKTKDDISIK